MSDEINVEKGEISIHTDNILPIIKKWLYSDREIFIRELVSNAVDAISKIKQLSGFGEYKDPLGELEVKVSIDTTGKTLKFIDNGIGMTREEVKKYINQIAFSGAEDFIAKYKDNKEENQIIGHFGLGFYSAFMVSDKVEIFTKSFTGEPAVHWINDGGVDFSLEDSDKNDRGTEIILHINSESEEFLDESRLKAVIEKYCNFLPVPIKVNDKVVNDQHPLWLKNSKDIKDEEFKEFYNKLFPFEGEPIFWIKLDVEVPFRLRGIVYFPTLKHELDSSKGRIKLYCNQVFVSDQAKELIPEFLTLLQGTLDIPDIPLNVSRSYLQNDPYVRKISEYITKKVAEKIVSLAKNERELFEKNWDDISIFAKYGMMHDPKFYDKVKDIVIYKTTNGEYKTLEKYIEDNKEKNKKKNDKDIILYTTGEKDQISYINMIKASGQEALVLNSLIDVHYIHFIETKNDKVTFSRIDSDTHDTFENEDKNDKILDADAKSKEDKIKDIFEKVLNSGDSKIVIKASSLKDEETQAVLVQSEYMRRFKEMNSFLNKMAGDSNDDFTNYTLIVNSGNKIIKKIVDIDQLNDNEKVNKLVNYVYSLALLSQNRLKGERLIEFIKISNELLV